MKKFLSLILTVVLLLSLFLSQNVFAATSARFGGNDYCSVTISKSLMQSKKYKTATVKITSHDLTGKKSSGKLSITLTDEKGNYIGTYTKKSGDTIKLGNDHSGYRIYISAYMEPENGGFVSTVLNRSANFKNSGKCQTWKVSNNKNCSIR